jgi:hypothetical protein
MFHRRNLWKREREWRSDCCPFGIVNPTMPSMKATIEALETAGLRDKVKVMVGGARSRINMQKRFMQMDIHRMQTEP